MAVGKQEKNSTQDELRESPGEQLLRGTGKNYDVLRHLEVLQHILPRVQEDVWFANQALSFGQRLEVFLNARKDHGKIRAEGAKVLRLLSELS